MTFVVGVFVGVVLVMVLGWWVGRNESLDGLTAARAQRELVELERQTIQTMIATELAARRPPASSWGSAIESSAIEVRDA